jgi:hypothetical protein
VTSGVAIGNDETAIGSHPSIAPIAGNLVRQGGVEPEAPPGQPIEWAAGTPVESEKATRLAGSRCGDLRPFHDNDIDPATTEEIGGAGAHHTATTDHNTHGFSTDEQRNRMVLRMVA